MLQDRTKQKVYEKFDNLRMLVTGRLLTEVAGREIVDILRRATIETKVVLNHQYGEPCPIKGEKNKRISFTELSEEEKKYIEHDIDILVDICSKLPEDNSNRLDKTISDIGYVLDSLKLLRDIESTGDCNICKNKRRCVFEPEVGQMVRYNCPFYKEDKNDET